MKKPPNSAMQDLLLKKQEKKKVTTKEMINQALTMMKSRRGTSLYAIKKYIQEQFQVDIEKNNYIIKKSIKDGVEGGTIIQTKGVGAAGSFKLVSGATSKKKTLTAETEKKPKEKILKNKEAKVKEKVKNKMRDKVIDKVKNKIKDKATDKVKVKGPDKVKNVDKKILKNNKKKEKSKITKNIAKGLGSPAKKKANMVKRKSIGSIIKPPKMKPSTK